MKKFLMAAAATMAVTTPAWAQASLDADGDGAVTLEDIQMVSPEVTADGFAAAQAAGTLPAVGGETSAAEAPAE